MNKSKLTVMYILLVGVLAIFIMMATIIVPVIVDRLSAKEAPSRNETEAVDYTPYIQHKSVELPTGNWKDRPGKYQNIKYLYTYHTGVHQATEDYLSYMTFRNNWEAKKVFKQMKKDGYESFEEEEETYFIGWEKDVCDASIKEMVCLCGNTIILAEICVVSEWATTEEDTSPNAWSYPERKEYIIEHFVD